MKPKKLFLLIVLFTSISFESFAQIDSLIHDRYSTSNIDNQIDHYLKKSRNQKKLAWIFLGGGLGLNLIGSSLATSNYRSDYTGYDVISGIGSLAAYGSIPLFFASSKNKNKAQILYFQKSMTNAATDSLRRIYAEDAAEYFNSKARANTTAAIVMTAVGTAMIIGGAVAISNNNSDGTVNDFFNDAFAGPLLVVTGVVVDLVSIPFYVRAARHRNNAKMIMKTGRMPTVGVGAVTPTIHSDRYVAVGIAIQL